MKKLFTFIAAALLAVGANAQVQTVASYAVTQSSTLAGDDNTPDGGTGCSVQLHGTTIDVKDGVHYGLKLDSEAKYVQIDFDDALEAGDQVNISFFLGGNASVEDKDGVQLSNAKTSAEDYQVLAYMYAQPADKKNLVTKEYTADGGEKKFIVQKIFTGASSFFHAVVVKRGSSLPTAATTWDFTQLSSTDKANLEADTNWESADFDGDTGWKNANTLAARNVYIALTANNANLALTEGLLFARDNSAGLGAGQVVIKEGKALNLTGSVDLIKIENLAKNDIVRVKFYSNAASEARGFNVTNATPASIMSASKDDVAEAELTVSADGDLILSTTKSVNIVALTINAEFPTGIESVKAAAAKADSAIYNLAGQKVNNDFKGIAIQNGKKVILK